MLAVTLDIGSADVAFGALHTAHPLARARIARALRCLDMTTYRGERAPMQGRMSEPARGSDGAPVRPDVDELRQRFQGQPDPGFARARSREARNARGSVMAVAVIMASVCLFVMVQCLTSTSRTALWAVAPGVGAGFCALSVELARRGRTRWATVALMLGVACGVLGEGGR
ncbi:hypothetical protein ACM01_30815 [Streptomyces viridochromogenes]|uniref:Uncharacterized protein n=1 Tax=Streptomyces viridochromogenes TaxID=1938 RepID=A0A0J7Z654_STRVR|nr:hypothetical protein ACM01_30815 [Streptomyces viridochromogenes]KOG16789.1 hypothetical protein ADK36_26575 [Streptomyces viridochromogenes]KOG17973.1 hypothetical protein ADK35_23430 [Streptomyces viridochromogenes]